MASNLNDDDMISGINVTPLVDVVLVLLVIFMITAPFIYQSAIKVELPSASTGQQGEKSTLTFTLTKEEKVLWNDQLVEWSALGERLKQTDFAPDASAVINADQATPHGSVVRLMDALRAAGLLRFALNVNQK